MLTPIFSKLKQEALKLSGKMVLQKVLDGHNEPFNNYLLTQKGSKTVGNNPKITINEVHSL